MIAEQSSSHVRMPHSNPQTLSQRLAKKWRKWFHAEWFTYIQLILKTLFILLDIVIIYLVFSWESQSVTVLNLTFEMRARVIAFVVVPFGSAALSATLIILGLTQVEIGPTLHACISGAVLTLWFFSAPIMSATVTELSESQFARWKNLNVLKLELATAFGLFCMAFSVLDILLAFKRLTKIAMAPKQLPAKLKSSPQLQFQSVSSGARRISSSVRRFTAEPCLPKAKDKVDKGKGRAGGSGGEEFKGEREGSTEEED